MRYLGINGDDWQNEGVLLIIFIYSQGVGYVL